MMSDDEVRELRLLFTTGVWERWVAVDSSGDRHLVTRIPASVLDDSEASIQQALNALRPFQEVRSPCLPVLLGMSASSDEELEFFHKMPFGGSLGDLVDQSGPVRVPLAGALAWKLANALDALHAAGLHHGSLAMDKVLLSRDCELVLLDAALVTGCMAMHPTLRFPDSRWEHVHPHPAFTAPEVIAADRDSNIPSDVFALAVMIASLLLGRNPFSGNTSLAIHASIQRGSHTVSTDLAGLLEAPAVMALSAGMSADPRARPSSASALITAVFGPEETYADLALAAAYCGRHLSAWNHDARIGTDEDSESLPGGTGTLSRRDRLRAATFALDSSRKSSKSSLFLERPWLIRAVLGIVAGLVMLSVLLSR
jgi:serine/threonine protein kinase